MPRVQKLEYSRERNRYRSRQDVIVIGKGIQEVVSRNIRDDDCVCKEQRNKVAPDNNLRA